MLSVYQAVRFVTIYNSYCLYDGSYNHTRANKKNQSQNTKLPGREYSLFLNPFSNCFYFSKILRGIHDRNIPYGLSCVQVAQLSLPDNNSSPAKLTTIFVGKQQFFPHLCSRIYIEFYYNCALELQQSR